MALINTHPDYMHFGKGIRQISEDIEGGKIRRWEDKKVRRLED